MDEETEAALIEQRGKIIQAQIAAEQMLKEEAERMQEETPAAVKDCMPKTPVDVIALSGVEAGNLRGHAAYRAATDMSGSAPQGGSEEKGMYSRRA